MQFPGLYSRILLFIHLIYNDLNLLILNSQSFPPSPHPTWQPQVCWVIGVSTEYTQCRLAQKNWPKHHSKEKVRSPQYVESNFKVQLANGQWEFQGINLTQNYQDNNSSVYACVYVCVCVDFSCIIYYLSQNHLRKLRQEKKEDTMTFQWEKTCIAVMKLSRGAKYIKQTT